MTKIRAVIFDLDGTLIFFRIRYMDARREVIHALVNYGIPNDLMSLEKRIIDNLRIAEKYFQKVGIRREKIVRIKKQIEKIVSRYEMEGARKTNLIPGARELLIFLKTQQYKIGLFTLENREVTDYILERFSLSSFFDSVVTRTDVVNTKPHPDHLRMILKQLEVSSNEIIVVGDNPIDIECGKQINAITVARLSVRHERDEFVQAGAEYIIENLVEINEIITKIF